MASTCSTGIGISNLFSFHAKTPSLIVLAIVITTLLRTNVLRFNNENLITGKMEWFDLSSPCVHFIPDSVIQRLH